MSTLGLQDVFEPYYEGRKTGFATIDPSAVEKARKVKERIEEVRRAKHSRQADRSTDKAA
jgi:hypothetical protein